MTLAAFAAFGDSITAGEDGTYAITTRNERSLQFTKNVILDGFEYPTVLQSILRARYPFEACAIRVTNLGRPSEQAAPPIDGSESALTRFSREVLMKGFDAVLIMEGSNDCYFAPDDNGKRLPLAINSIRAMIRAASSMGVRPYLATVPPAVLRSACIPACRGYGEGFVPGFNDQVRQLARSEGISLVDVYQAFGGDLSLLSTDGLHPNANGYQRIADTFLNVLNSTAETTLRRPTLCDRLPF